MTEQTLLPQEASTADAIGEVSRPRQGWHLGLEFAGLLQETLEVV
jgi:hypothetical protein